MAVERDIYNAITREIIESQGFSPLNFTPFVEVQKVVSVRKVRWFDPPEEFTTTNVKGQLLFREIMEVTPPEPGERYGFACIVWNEAEGRKYFIPWPVADLLVNGTQSTMAYFVNVGEGTMLGDNWWFSNKNILGGRLNLEYVDSRAGRKPQRFTHLVVLQLGRTKTSEQLTQHLKLTMKSEWFSEIPCDSQDADVDMFEEPKSLDPVTLTKITIPVRPRTCRHAQALDLNGAVGYLNQKLPVGGINGLACPSCNEFFYIRDLIVDKTFMNFLKDTSRSEKITSVEDYCQRYNAGTNSTRDSTDPPVMISGGNLIVHRPSDAASQGRLLTPCCSLEGHYQETGISRTYSETVPCAGIWRTYPGIPMRYFVREKAS
eukprot:TRINITY_DN28722_c0_g1_i1.p1 TRINITY_DN28722_c0_g1~~TRINITY_DN28722_c0_g1_i1.p1  ORF type:complete len:375 (+),score=41.15 TRINITY_DN28722_c0_g1_i1:34-1158(+)